MIDKTIDALKIEILLKEYDAANSNYNNVLSEYRQQINFMNIYIGVLGAVVFFLLKDETKKYIDQNLNSDYAYFIFLLISISVMFYIYSLGIDIVYNLYLCEGRAAAVEEKINKYVGEDLLVWNCRAIPHFNLNFTSSNWWISPPFLLGVFNGFMVLFVTVLHCGLAYILIKGEFPKFVFISVTPLILFYLIYQLFINTMIGQKYIHKYFYGVYGIVDESDHFTMKRNLVIIPVLTFFMGFFSFLIYSVISNTFWLDAKCSIPFVVIFTISIGDFIFLPIINYRIAKLAYEYLGDAVLKENYSRLRIWLIIGFCTSLVLNSITHYFWATDKFTDFMSLDAGSLTIGGWWHYIFSIFEMVVMIQFIPLWLIAIDTKNVKANAFAKRTFQYIFIFSCLLILNFVHQYFYVFGEPNFFKALLTAKFTFFPILIYLLIYIGIQMYESRNKGDRYK